VSSLSQLPPHYPPTLHPHYSISSFSNITTEQTLTALHRLMNRPYGDHVHVMQTKNLWKNWEKSLTWREIPAE